MLDVAVNKGLKSIYITQGFSVDAEIFFPLICRSLLNWIVEVKNLDVASIWYLTRLRSELQEQWSYLKIPPISSQRSPPGPGLQLLQLPARRSPGWRPPSWAGPPAAGRGPPLWPPGCCCIPSLEQNKVPVQPTLAVLEGSQVCETRQWQPVNLRCSVVRWLSMETVGLPVHFVLLDVGFTLQGFCLLARAGF